MTGREVSGEPIKMRDVYMIANGRALFRSQPIRRPKTAPIGRAGRYLFDACAWVCTLLCLLYDDVFVSVARA